MGATRESPSLDEATEDAAELGELRRRAYGPAADIFDDSGALARLIELERRHGARGWMPLPEARTDSGDESTAAPTAEDDAGERPVGHRPRWRASALVATVAGAALLAGAVLSAVGGSSSEATLYPRTQVAAAAAQELDSAGDLRYLGIDRAGAELYDEFRGLNVWSARRGPQTICLFITLDRFTQLGRGLHPLGWHAHDHAHPVPRHRGPGGRRAVPRRACREQNQFRFEGRCRSGSGRAGHRGSDRALTSTRPGMATRVGARAAIIDGWQRR